MCPCVVLDASLAARSRRTIRLYRWSGDEWCEEPATPLQGFPPVVVSIEAIQFTWTYNALIRPISARYPAGLSLRASERILVSRLERRSRQCLRRAVRQRSTEHLDSMLSEE